MMIGSRSRFVAILAVFALVAGACEVTVSPPPPTVAPAGDAGGVVPFGFGGGPTGPEATLDVPPSSLIGQSVSFGVTFDNTDASIVGYGPFVQLVFPANGTDGAGGTDTPDGLTFTSATLLGATLPASTQIFPPSGTLTNPLTGQSVTGTPGDQLVILELPFGSFTPAQPALTIDVTAAVSNLADPGVALPITALGGFRFGDSPNGSTPVLQDPPVTASTTPQVFTMTKTYLGPENETATGPNFTRTYRITADIANGQTIANLTLRDQLPPQAAFVSVSGISPGGGAVQPPTPPVNVASAATPVVVTWASVTGGSGSADASFDVTFFVPRVAAGGAPVLSATSGAPVTMDNVATGLGDWIPTDPRDPPVAGNATATTDTVTITARSLATQKSVAVATDVAPPGLSPGDVLEYTVDVQVSDYFAFDQVVITDTLGDGQKVDATFAPRLATTRPASVSAAMAPANVTSTFNGVTGVTDLSFRVSDELVTRGAGPRLVGGCVPSAGTGGPPPSCATNVGPTTAAVVFRAVVQSNFTGPTSGSPGIDQGDVVGNDASVSGRVLAVADATSPTGSTVTDDTSVDSTAPKGILAKSVYAVNGSTTLSSPVTVQPGDTVTYKLSYALPLSSVEDFRIDDFLPLPVFDATEVATFAAGPPSATPPPAGTVSFGAGDTFNAVSGIVPTLSSDAGGNSVSFDYGSFTPAVRQASTAELLFTVTATDRPFVDGLFLTNLAQATESNSTSSATTSEGAAQIQSQQPKLAITKGVIAADTPDIVLNPANGVPPAVGPATAPGSAGFRLTGTLDSTLLAASPIDSNAGPAQAGDVVSFAVVVQNTGRGSRGAYDVTIADTLPAGMAVPGTGLNLSVTDGTGAALPYTSLGGGLLGAVPGSAIRLDDPSAAQGALTAFSPTSGTNLVIITYDLVLTADAQIGTTLTNTASVTRYAAVEGGNNFLVINGVPQPIFDPASVDVGTANLLKVLAATSSADTLGSSVAIGEVARYRLRVIVPQGTAPGAKIIDNLPAGLQFLDDGTAKIAFVSNGAGLTASGITDPAAFVIGDALTAPSITPTSPLPASAIVGGPFGDGTDPTFSLGTVVNADDDNDQELVLIEFNALVLNTAANVAGSGVDNTFFVQTDSLTTPNSGPATITVVEPSITDLNKSVVGTVPTDANDVATYEVTFSNAASVTGSTAHDVVLVDVLPATLVADLSSVTVTASTGATGIVDQSSGNTIRLRVTALTSAGSLTVRYQARLAASVEPAQVLTNNVAVTYTSLAGTGGASNPTGSVTPGASGAGDGERNGDGGVNDYRDDASAQVTVNNLTAAKTVVATSEASTAGTDVAIGEVVRYRTVTRVPEGTATDLRLVDSLPAGLHYFDDGTTKVAFVADTPASFTSSTLSGAGLGAAGNETTIGAITPTFVLPAGSISGGPFGDGTDPTFTLGTITNADNDTNDEFVVLEFNALVRNVAGNTVGVTRDNTYTASTSTGASASSTPGTALVTVVEPGRFLTKTASSANVDAGDVVTFTVAYSNPANATATAFDVALTDPVPAAAYTLNVASVAVALTDGAVGPVTNTSAGNTVAVSVAAVPPGGWVNVTYTATVVNTVQAGVTLTNTATVRYTSLPGALGTTSNPTGSATPGVAGTATGERTGSGASPNVYTTDASATVTVGPVTTAKSIAATSEAGTGSVGGTQRVTIGEIVRYRVQVRIPESTTPQFNVLDNLPNGLQFLDDGTARTALVSTDTTKFTSSQAGMSGAGLNVVGNETTVASIVPTFVVPSGAIAGGPFGNGTDPVFNYGTLTNLDNDANQEFVVLEFNALVLNLGTGTAASGNNQAGTNRDNTASPRRNTTVILTSPSVRVSIAEPQLSITKATAPNAGLALVDAGDTFNYTLTITNTNTNATAPAYDVAINDVIPSSLVAGTPTVAITGTVTGVVDTSVGNTIAVTVGSMARNASIVITIPVTVAGTVTPGLTIANTGDITYSSLPGTNGTSPNPTGSVTPGASGSGTGERNGSGGATNDYLGSSTRTLAVGGVDVAKAVADTDKPQTSGSDLVPGEVATYRVRINLPEGTTPAFTLTDQLPVGMEYVPGTVAVLTTVQSGGGANLAANFNGTVSAPTSNEPTGNGPLLSLGFSAVTVAGDNVANNNAFLVQYQARLRDEAGNSAGKVLTNTVNALGQTATATVTVRRVDVTVTKSDGGVSTSPGGTVAYTLTVGNNGNQPATGVVLTETVPANSTFWAAGSSAGWSCADGAAAGTTCTLAVGTVNPAASVARAFGVRADVPLAAGVTQLSNTTTVTDDGANGSDLNTSNNTATDTTPIVVGTLGDKVFDDVNGNGVFDAGEGIGGVDLTITWAGPDGDVNTPGDNVVFTTTTDSLGTYGVTNLPAGVFDVTVDPLTIPPYLTRQTVFPVLPTTLAAGATNLNIDFGYRRPNRPPVVQPGTATTCTNTKVTLDAAALTSDPDFDTLAITVPPTSAAGGITTIAAGIISYTPPFNFTGYDVVSYTATDPDGLSATSVFQVFVSADCLVPNDRMYRVALGGTSPGSGPGTYDQITTSGALGLSTEQLVIGLRNGFVPTPGQTFDVWVGSAFRGTFAKVYGQVLANGVVFDVRVLPDRVQLVATQGQFVDTSVASLEAAVTAANANADGDTIVLAPRTTYALTNPLVFTQPTSIIGGDAVVDGQNAVRPLQFAAAAAGRVSSLTVTNGASASGAGALTSASSNLVLDDVIVSSSSGAVGGGVGVTAGALTMNRGSVVGNFGTVDGGGVAVNAASLTLSGTTVSTNTATGNGGGLLLTSAAVATLTNVRLTGNAAGSGGGVFVDPTSSLNGTRVTIANNTATTVGAGVLNGGVVSFADSRISANTAGTDGGGVASTGTTTLSRVTLDANSAASGGGGIVVSAGTTTVDTSTLSANAAANGGAVWQSGGSVNLVNTTITGTATSGGAAGAVEVGAGSATLTNSVLGDQSVGASCAGAVASGGSNLTDVSCTLGGAGDTNAATMGLGALANNGGFAPTHLPSATSLAVNTSTVACSGVDQRSFARPRGGACDKGAIER
jgi:uncharacterized repeat protein (TIGR01451 family)/fimbrial isopeptide formation D2 family protein